MKKILAKTIYYGAIALMFVLTLVCLALFVWFLIDTIGPTGWAIIGVMTGLSAIAIGLVYAYDWARKYLDDERN